MMRSVYASPQVSNQITSNEEGQDRMSVSKARY
ncbi:hypothetical protein KC19_11G045600 [Ceratodon purpureus]|uniref:Uncharacterized protein n=1 Tax=Ceratodon purpureus TaxID=3225 RepID=A0A8T0GCV4_CERPU|nr:hypothetical protein KC19_11G045600 [Ceratodon purpureus]